jgi:hypothetical protein
MIENNDEVFAIVTKNKHVLFETKEELQSWLKIEYNKDYTIEQIDVILNKPHMLNIIEDSLDLYF